MNIEKLTFYVTKTTTFEIEISKDEGYDMPKTPKELVELVTSIQNNPAQELAWSSSNATDDTFVIDNYDIKEAAPTADLSSNLGL
tara:strand:- start:794 stop:1048 length:255 start_codon:yes stop_codon:yes gene_type:complete